MTWLPKVKLAGVIGHPIGHSKSPLMYTYWLNKYNIEGVYMPLSVTPENFKEVLKTLPKMGFSGISVTIPHKVTALKSVDIVSQEAKKAGAVNIIVFRQDGLMVGHNTDGFGFIENLKDANPDLNFHKSTAVVLGTGGASRGICSALIEAGCFELKIVYRTKEKAQQIAENIGGNVSLVPWDLRSEVLSSADIFANATSLGMVNCDPLDISLDLLKPTALVCDLVYAPLETEVLKKARLRHNLIADGLGMLLHQARPAFQHWFGILPEITSDLRKMMEK